MHLILVNQQVICHSLILVNQQVVCHSLILVNLQVVCHSLILVNQQVVCHSIILVNQQVVCHSLILVNQQVVCHIPILMNWTRFVITLILHTRNWKNNCYLPRLRASQRVDGRRSIRKDRVVQNRSDKTQTMEAQADAFLNHKTICLIQMLFYWYRYGAVVNTGMYIKR